MLESMVSFIIPALNEEVSIGELLQSIHSGAMPCAYEVIVVDHDSKDNTRQIAEQVSAKVLLKKGGTIGSVRNIGVVESKGNILVFLDADIILTEQWFSHIGDVIALLEDEPLLLLGSHCCAPDKCCWIEENWFNSYVEEKNTQSLGSGHMITSRELFEGVDGFSEELTTGEDYDFCIKAKALGARLISDPKLKVIHTDYPKTIKQFVVRETWHGRGDVLSIQHILKSKVALVALLFAILHFLLLLAWLLPGVTWPVWLFLLMSIVVVVVGSSWKKFGHCNLRVILLNSIIFYFYFVGRAMSFVKGR